MTTKEDTKEPLLSRWSRLKQESKQQPAEKPPAQPAADPKAPAPELPPLDKLTFDSDYRDFFHPKVDEGLRRAALKKLFSDPHFNVMDGLDTYIDDYSKNDPIPAEMLAQMKSAQKILGWAKEDAEKRDKEEAERLRAKEEAPPRVPEPPTAPSTSTEARPDAPDAVPVVPADRRTDS